MISDADLPDLNAIPRTEWREVLKPLSESDRRRAVWAVRDIEAQNEGLVLTGFLLVEDPLPIRDVPVPDVPAGAAVTKAAPTSRVVSFRLSADQYARVSRLARALEMKPTALARLMVVRGVDASLRERS